MESDLINNVIKQDEIEELAQRLSEGELQKCKCVLWGIVDLMEKFLEKEYRFHYMQTVMRFVHNLIKLSLKLKNFAVQSRKEELTKYLKKANKYIHAMKGKFAEVQQFQGIVLPFYAGRKEKHNSNLVVRIVENDFTCFNTRKRVPYRIIVETIE